MNAPDLDDTSPTEYFLDLRQYAYILWHWFWLIALVAVLASGGAYLLSKRQTPIYQATTTLMVNQAPGNKTTSYDSVLTSQMLTSTYAQMITTQPVLDEVAKSLGLPYPGVSLKGSIRVTPVSSTQLISVSVELPDPTQAAQVANSLAVVFTDQIQAVQASRFAASKQTLRKQLDEMDQQIQNLTAQSARESDQAQKDRLEDKLAQYRQIYASLLSSFEDIRLSEAQTVSTVNQVEAAVVPGAPIRPKILQNTLLAGVAGALLAVVLVFLFELLDDTIRDPDVFLKKYHLSVLGIIAHHKQEDGEPVVKRLPRSPVAEAFRSLRTNVQYASVDKPLRTILVTSPTPSDGKSTIASNLAVVLAQGGSKVFLLDADLRRPMIHRMLGAQNRIGLSSMFVQQHTHLNGSVQHINKLENVSVITSGVLPPNPSELLGSKKMREILNVVLEHCDMVILDTPPVLSVTDAVVLAPAVDGVLLVINPGATKQTAFRQSLAQLNQVGANILGVVVNEVGSRGGYNNYYYRKYYQNHYGYRYAYAEEKKKRKPVFGKWRIKDHQAETELDPHSVSEKVAVEHFDQ